VVYLKLVRIYRVTIFFPTFAKSLVLGCFVNNSDAAIYV
jgi:hypothetical protein